jgi:hypothetical protein
MKKKYRRKLNAILRKVFESNKEELEATLEREGRVELILDLGNGESISLGVLEREK